jgi:hypothetical protein
VIDVLKFVGAPGSIPFFVLTTAVGLLLARRTRRLRRAGVAWLVVVVTGYLGLALPVVATAIAGALPSVVATPAAVAQPASRSPVEILIVLDGDNRRGRVREVQRAIRDHTPHTVWVLGGRWIVEALTEAGVMESRFRYDESAGTTRIQIDQIEGIARATTARAAVIASRLQAPRVAALLARRKIPVRVLPSPVDDEPPVSGAMMYVPAYTALRVSRDAFYEHVAIAYYRWRGWIA